MSDLNYQVSDCFPFGPTWSDMNFAVDWVFRIKHPLCCLVSFRNPDGRVTYFVPQRCNPRNQLNKWKASIHLCEVECMPWCLIINLYDRWLWIDNSVAVCLTQRTETAGTSHSTVVRTCQLAREPVSQPIVPTGNWMIILSLGGGGTDPCVRNGYLTVCKICVNCHRTLQQWGNVIHTESASVDNTAN